MATKKVSGVQEKSNSEVRGWRHDSDKLGQTNVTVKWKTWRFLKHVSKCALNNF